MKLLMGPAPCVCGAPVFLVKDATVYWAVPGTNRAIPWLAHRCKGGRRCGALMPNAQERCARYQGHRSEHRSRYALENARAAA